jgi:hypothetical protein
VATQVLPEQANAVAPLAGQATHLPPHAIMEPELQLIPHVVPLQLAVPFGSIGHGVHDVPQLAVDMFETQAPEQT